MKNKKYYILAIIGLLIVGLISYKPILRWQVEKRVSGVEFQDISLNLSGVTLSSVKVDKGWITGNIDTVTSDFQGDHLLIEGGSLSVNLNNRSKQKEDVEKQKRDIQYSGLTLKVVYHEYNLSLKEVRSSGDQICFSEAKLESPALTAIDGCLQKETKIADIEKVKVDYLKFMEVQVQDLNAHKVKFNLNEKTVEVNSVKTQVTFEKQTASIEAINVRAFKKTESIHLDSVKAMHPWLASDWTTFKNVEVKHSDKWSVSVGSSQFQVEPDTLTFSGAEDCSTWIDSLPNNLKTKPLDQIKFNGKVNFSVGLRPKPSFNLKADCRAVCSSLPNLRGPFTYTAYTPKHEPFERKSGLHTMEWVSIELMGDMPLAAKNMEDPGFDHHRGFIPQAFANSLTDNLKEGKFFRGGSTITMQLAKNIWLTREKTLGRKVQEFFLAQALESCYSKDEILELYLNVVEFGPNKYGVASGAQHWFKKSPGELSPAEAFWMASILPRPSRTNPPDDASIKRIEGLMKKMATDGRIPEFMLDMVGEPEEESLEN
jgi:hypothetical protein